MRLRNFALIVFLIMLSACAAQHSTIEKKDLTNFTIDETHFNKEIVITFPAWTSESDKLAELNLSAKDKALNKCKNLSYKITDLNSNRFVGGYGFSGVKDVRNNAISANIQCDEVIKDISTASFSKDKNNVNNLPECQGRYVSRWTNCFGTITIGNGSKYVGEFNNGKEHGRGIFYSSNGTILNQGIWADGKFAQSQTVQQLTDLNIETETLINQIQNPKRRQSPK